MEKTDRPFSSHLWMGRPGCFDFFRTVLWGAVPGLKGDKSNAAQRRPLKDHCAGLSEPPRTRRLPSPSSAGSPPIRRLLDQTGASHLKSSRISRLSAWKGMFRTRILEVVCFLGTCFFRAEVRAGLQGGERVQVTRGVSRCCLTLTPPPPTPMLVFCSGEGFKELVWVRLR